MITKMHEKLAGLNWVNHFKKNERYTAFEQNARFDVFEALGSERGEWVLTISNLTTDQIIFSVTSTILAIEEIVQFFIKKMRNT